MTTVAGHRVGALDEERSRLTLSLDVRGFITPVIALFSKRMINRYLPARRRA